MSEIQAVFTGQVDVCSYCLDFPQILAETMNT